MEWHEPCLAELRFPDFQHAAAKINVDLRKTQRLRDAESSACQQTDERDIRAGAQTVCRGKSPRRRQQGGQLMGGVDMGNCSPMSRAQ